MKISEILEICEGTLMTPEIDLETEVLGGYAGDLMSDVLASIQPGAVLISGLINPQVVRTALIADVRLIVFGRGKKLAPETIELANTECIPVITSKLGLFEISGRLMKAGLTSYESQMLRTFEED